MLWSLFLVFMQIGALSFGGGISAIMLIQQIIVEKYGWLTMEQYADIVTIAEVTPGPMGINAATFVGTQTAGIPGALIATAGFVLPSFLIVLTLGYFFFKFSKIKGVHTVVDTLKPAIAAIVTGAGVSILLLALFGANEYSQIDVAAFDWYALALFVVALFVLRKWKKVSPILVILSTGAFGLFYLLM